MLKLPKLFANEPLHSARERRVSGSYGQGLAILMSKTTGFLSALARKNKPVCFSLASLDNKKIPLVFGVFLVLLAVVTAVIFFYPRQKIVQPDDARLANESAPAKEFGLFGDGLLVGVLIDGFTAAKPQAGLDWSPLVFEFPVEAAIPRYLAFFSIPASLSEENDKSIGPVRSLRPYFLDLAQGFGAALAHVGGSPEAMSMLKKKEAVSLNQYFQSEYFYRTVKRPAPHNVYTNLTLLGEAGENNLLKEEAKKLNWLWLAEKPVKEDNINKAGKITISHHDPAYAVSWLYEPERNEYRRQQGGQDQIMADGEKIETSNVIVLWTDIKILDSVGRREIRTIGQGAARLFRQGEGIEGEWRRKDGEPFEFFDQNGQPWRFTAGKIWVQILGVGEEVKAE